MVRRRQLGAILRKRRLDAGLSVRDVAEHLMCHPAKISRLENAQRNISLRDVRDLCDYYNVSDRESRELMDLARESRETAWWQQFDLGPAEEKFFGLEGAATRIADFGADVIPGRFQTRDYAIAIAETFVPENVAEVVEMRMLRQQFSGIEADHRCVLDESALRRVVGSAEVMREQVRHLKKLATSATVDLRAIPFSRGAHRGMNSGFTVLQFGDSADDMLTSAMPDVVYMETLADDVFLDRPEDVKIYLDAFQGLQDKALSQTDTVNFLASMELGE
jgi:transcriptional regulator with XRE-family HTH domain